MASSLCIVDTSIFLNFLDVPGKNQNKETVETEFKDYVSSKVNFSLPMATILETGNHIAQLSDGGHRRKIAERFVKAICDAIDGTAPWQAAEFPRLEEVRAWLHDFPDTSMRKIGFGDLSIIKEYEAARTRFPTREVFIWSTDNDLQGYRYTPPDWTNKR